MITKQKGMNISPEEYMHVIDNIFMAIDKNNIDEGKTATIFSERQQGIEDFIKYSQTKKEVFITSAKSVVNWM